MVYDPGWLPSLRAIMLASAQPALMLGALAILSLATTAALTVLDAARKEST